MNYVAQPTVEVIQILLIISNVLSYNMNAGASYTLLGEYSCSVGVRGRLIDDERNDGANVHGPRSSCRNARVFAIGTGGSQKNMVRPIPCLTGDSMLTIFQVDNGSSKQPFLAGL